jgi:hypothetical protein
MRKGRHSRRSATLWVSAAENVWKDGSDGTVGKEKMVFVSQLGDHVRSRMKLVACSN